MLLESRYIVVVARKRKKKPVYMPLNRCIQELCDDGKRSREYILMRIRKSFANNPVPEMPEIIKNLPSASVKPENQFRKEDCSTGKD